MAGVLVCVATIRLWKILQIAQVFRLFTYTLYNAGTALLSCLLLMITFLLGYSLCIYLVNGSQSSVLHNLRTILPAITAVAFGFEPFKFEHFMYGGHSLGIILFVVMLVAINIYLLNMFITVIVYYFDQTKDREKETTKHYSFRQFFNDRLKHLDFKGLNKLCFQNTEPEVSKAIKDYKLDDKKLKSFVEATDAQFDFLDEYLMSLNQSKCNITHKDIYRSIKVTAETLNINIRATISMYDTDSE